MHIKLSRTELDELKKFKEIGKVPANLKSKNMLYKFKAKAQMFSFENNEVIHLNIYFFKDLYFKFIRKITILC